MCRNFLLAMAEICHKALFTPPVRLEWDKHASRFSQGWRRQMVARKKLTVLRGSDDPAVVDGIQLVCDSKHQREEMTKDAHLVEAAIASGAPIASLDDAARNLYRKLASALPAVRDVVWVNPAALAERAVPWLEAGAPSEPERMLGTGTGWSR
jgi:hypothetical protein